MGTRVEFHPEVEQRIKIPWRLELRDRDDHIILIATKKFGVERYPDHHKIDAENLLCFVEEYIRLTKEDK